MAVARGRVVLAAAFVSAAVVAWRLVGSWPGSVGPGGPGEPVELPLLWIEEINNRLLPRGSGPAGHPPGAAFGPASGAGVAPAADEDRRVLRLPTGSLSSRGAEPVLLLRYGVYDHDLLIHETFTAVSADLPWELDPPPAVGDAAARLLPRRLRITGVDAGGAVLLEVDGRSLRLDAGRAWATARVAQGSRVVQVDAARWSQQLAAALDRERPVTVLRLLNRGRWHVETAGGDGR